MRKRILAAAFSAATCIAHAQTASTPTATIVVNALSASSTPRDGFTRLRLSLTSNEPSASETARLAGVALCTATTCYESGAPSTVRISSTADGTSTLVAELEVPYSNIESVRFKSVAGPGVLQGSVALPEPLKLEKDYRGGDVLVVVQKRGIGFVPVGAASNYVQPDGMTFFYNPTFASTVKLTHGVTLAIPAGATKEPHVFLAGTYDTGDDYPFVGIYPPVPLAKAATVQMPLIARATASVLSNQAPKTSRPQAVPPGGVLASQAQVQAARASGPLVVEINATGSVPRETRTAPAGKQSALSPTSDGLTGSANVAAAAAACNQYGWCNCADQVAYPQNQLNIANGLVATGTTYLNWCTTIAPYVHITVTNMADSRERFTVKHSPKVNAGAATNYVPGLPLMRITSWSQYTQVMMNGFTWQGDDGVFSGSYGRAEGHVHNFSIGLGDNLVSGGGCEDYPTPQYNPCNTFTPAGNKRVMLMPATGTAWSWVDNAAAGIISNSLSYVSSSTSILKDGVCASGTEASRVSRWSAVGSTSGGRLIFMSSTTDGTTSAAELCPVFQAMGAFNAIRLDGGPSAAMALDGALLNPLTGTAYFLKYGNMRYIAYALKLSYPGW